MAVITLQSCKEDRKTLRHDLKTAKSNTEAEAEVLIGDARDNL